MDHKAVTNWKDCRDSRTVENVVKDHGGTVREAAGSHKVATLHTDRGDTSMTFYESRDISTGVAVKIFKWLRNAGIVVIILGFLIRGLMGNVCNESNFTSVTTYPTGEVVYNCGE